MKNKLFLFLLIFFFVLAAFSPLLPADIVLRDSVTIREKPKPLSLDQCINYSLKNANTVSSAAEKIRSNYHKLSAAKREYFPKAVADINGGMDQHLNPVVYSSAGLEMPIFWHAINVDKKIANSDLVSASYELDIARNELIKDVKEAYFRSLYARHLMKTQAVSIRQLREHLKVVKLLYKSGKVLKIDVLQVRAQLGREKGKYKKAAADRRYYDSFLNSLLDADLENTLHLEDVSFVPLALTQKECYDISTAEGPAEKIFSEKINKSQLEIDKVKRSGLKNLKVFGKFQRQVATYVNSADQDNFVFGLNGNLGLWDWFQNRQLVKEQQSNYESDIKEVDDLRDRQKIEIKRYYEELEIADGEAQSTERLIGSLEEEYKTQKVRFDYGQIKTDDLLQTQAMLSRARASYEKALLDRHLAKARINNAMGVNDTAAREGRNLKLSDEELLNLLARKAFNYFDTEYHKKSGLFLDAAGGGNSSAAAVGFGMSALVIGSERGWIRKEEARARTLAALRTLRRAQEKGGSKQGLFYHFLEPDTGLRASDSEVSNIDTAILMAGAVTAAEYFGGEVKEKVDELYRHIRWEFLLSKEEGHSRQFFLGWSPEEGFSPYYWGSYTDETLLVVMLALGSPVSDIPGDVYNGFNRSKMKYKDLEFYPSWSGSLFTYQYANIFYDFSNYRDSDGISWFENGIKATQAQIEYLKTLKKKSKTFEKGFWGVSAGEEPNGHYNMLLGVKPNLSGRDRLSGGVVVPSSVAGAIIHTPRESTDLLRRFYENYPSLWGKYGFTSSLDLDKNWFSLKFFALDVGLTLLAIDQYQKGTVQKYFMRSPYTQTALRKAGFRRKTDLPEISIGPKQETQTSKSQNVSLVLPGEKKDSLFLKVPRESEADKLFDSAQKLESQSGEDAAIKIYQVFASKFSNDPRAPKVFLKIANYERIYGESDKAVRIFEKIIQDYPQSAAVEDSFYLKGLAYYQNNHYSEAVQTWEQFLTRFPDSKKIPHLLNDLERADARAGVA